MRVRWFGEPWPEDSLRAGICDDDRYKIEPPLGKYCAGDCGGRIEPGERGVAMAYGVSHDGLEKDEDFAFEVDDHGIMQPAIAYHIDCLMLATTGPEIAELMVPMRRPPTQVPYYSDCVGWPKERLPLLEHLIENGEQITRDEFGRRVAAPDLPPAWDYHVTYWTLSGFPIYWYVHSSIEYVYAEEDALATAERHTSLQPTSSPHE